MDEREREALVQMLHRQREELLKEVAETEAELRFIAPGIATPNWRHAPNRSAWPVC